MKVREMSKVSSVFIIANRTDKDHLASLNMWLHQHGVLGNHPLGKISGESSAGDKYPQRDLYWGGFNFLNEDLFVDFFKTLKWEGTLLILGSEDSDAGYRVVIGDGDNYESRIKLEVPFLDNQITGFPAVEIKEYAKQEDQMNESDEYFNDLEL